MANWADIFSLIRCNFHKHTAVLAEIVFWFYTIADRFRKVLTFKAKILFGFYFVTELHGLGFTALTKFLRERSS